MKSPYTMFKLLTTLMIVVLGVIGVSAQDSTANTATDIPFSDWFILKANSAANWDMTSEADNPLEFTLTAKEPYAPDEQPYKILALFTKNSSSYNTAIDRILSIFMSKKIPLNLTAINFQNDPEEGQRVLEIAKQQQFDLIFSVGSDATDFIYGHFVGETIPVVSVTSKDPVLLNYLKDYETGSGTNIAYTSLNVPIELQMVYLQQLMPDLKNIAVMYADSNTSAKETQVEPLRDIAKDYNINIIDVVVYDNAQAAQELREAVPAAIEKITRTDPQHQNSIFWITGSTEVFREIETINDTSQDIPVLSAVPDVVQPGSNSAVLSIGVTFESNAHLAALYAIDILVDQANPGDLKVGVVSPPDIAINFMKARDINLKIPFSFFESASIVYDYEGKLVRKDGQLVASAN